MTPEQSALVQKTFENAYEQEEKLGELFYKKLFEMDPHIKALFKGHLREQGKMFMSMLRTVVQSFDHFDDVVYHLQLLARRHVAYGTKPEHYDEVGRALLSALEKVLGSEYNPKVKEAWEEAYSLISKTMKDAAHRK